MSVRYFPQRPGFVLLLTVVLLALVAAGLAGVARRSQRASLDANCLEARLQQRWLTRTAEDLLPHVGEWLDAVDAADVDSIATNPTSGIAPILASAAILLDLGHHHVELVLGDEQAKCNLNAVWDAADPAVGRDKLQRLISDLGLALLPRPRPIGTFEASAAGSSYDWPAFGTYDQLILTAAPASFAAAVHRSPGGREAGRWSGPSGDMIGLIVGPRSVDALPLLADHLTLWGDGRLRLDRASPAALRARLEPLLSPNQIERLLTAHAEGLAGLEALDTLELTERQRQQLATRVTAESSCFSVRLHLDDGRRVRTSLTVGEPTDNVDPRLHRFTW